MIELEEHTSAVPGVKERVALVQVFFFFFFSLLFWSHELNETSICGPYIRALLGTAPHFCSAVVLELRTVPLGTALSLVERQMNEKPFGGVAGGKQRGRRRRHASVCVCVCVCLTHCLSVPLSLYLFISLTQTDQQASLSLQVKNSGAGDEL